MTLGDRMKGLEGETRLVLPRRSWAVVRVDGRAFHTWTRGLERPFSPRLVHAMGVATEVLCREVAGAFCGYTQSDEISVVFSDLSKADSQPWFGGVVQKVASVAASCVTASFAAAFPDRPPALFDARVFALPDAYAVADYLVWRQRDAQKNAVSMLAQDRWSHRELMGVDTDERRRRLVEAGDDPADQDPRFLHGQLARRVERLEHVAYVDKRTGRECVTEEPCVRRPWESGAAPERIGPWVDGQLTPAPLQ